MSINTPAFRSLLLLTALLATTQIADAGQQSSLTQAQHPWGQFVPGTWKIVEVTTTEFAGGKPIRTVVTTTETTIESVTPTVCTLRVTVTTARDGLVYQATPQRIELQMGVERPGTIKTGQVVIAGQQIDGKVSQWTEAAADKNRERTVFVSTESPYVLTDTTLVKGLANSATTSRSVESRVTELNVPVKVLDDLQTGWRVKSVTKDGATTIVTNESHSEVVPGTLASATTTVTNAQGQMVRRSQSRIVSYGSTCVQVPRMTRRQRRQVRRRGR